VEHRTRLRYRSEYLRRPELLGWSAESVGGQVFVRGPCPFCGGDAGGPGLDRVEPTKRAPTDLPGVEEAEQVAEVVAECRCGASHGEDGKLSCGRYWTVRVARDD
jgi:hypothetical protein